IELTSYIDNKQNIRFKGKYIAQILGYNKKSFPAKTAGYSKSRGRPPVFINESGFYFLILSSKLESAKKFKHWVTSVVLPSIRKYLQNKLFDNPNNNMFKIGNGNDLPCKLVKCIRRFYPNSIMIAGLGENQDTPEKRINSWI
ncbi:unnamed protein product, partial [Porites evermanni]